MAEYSEFNREVQDRVLELARTDQGAAAELISHARPEDIAEWLTNLDRRQRQEIFLLASPELQGDILEDISPSDQADLVEFLEPERLGDILETMPPEEAAEIIAELEPGDTPEILDEIPTKELREIREVLSYPENSAGRIMDTDLIAVESALPVSQAIQRIRGSTIEETLYSVFVIDPKGKLLGMVPLKNLLLAPGSALLDQVMEEAFVSIKPTADQEEAARLVKKYDLAVLPVVDEQNRLVGRITADDILDVIDEEASEDILKMAGTDDEEFRAVSPLRIARIRLPWLLICIVGSFFSGLVIRSFEVTLERVIALVAFIPMITATGGNVGLQSSSIIIRALALGILRPSRVLEEVLRQMKVALLLGLSCGGILAAVAYLLEFGQDQGIFMGSVVGLAMFLAVSFSTLSGVLIPLFFNKLRIDPAVVSGPLITTLNDVLGISIYLGSATVMIKLFLS